MFWCKYANTIKHASEHSWLFGWVILSILAHLAHSVESYFSLIFSATSTYNCSWFDLINEKKWHWLKTKAWWKVTNAYDFFPHGDSRHYWYRFIHVKLDIRKRWHSISKSAKDSQSKWAPVFCVKISWVS